MSFYEELDFIKFDHDKLVNDVKQYVFPLGQQVIQGEEFETPQYNGFGGWSLQSQTGRWQDGFEFFQNEEGTTLEDVFFPKNANNYTTLKYFNITHSMNYNKPTEACVGEIKQVLDQIESLGMYPRRARVTCLRAGSKSLVHRDGPKQEYMARIHIPLITNDQAVFIADGTNLHMEAGKAYIVWVNDWHQIRNDGNEDRYHIIMDAYDTKYLTSSFHYEGEIAQLEDYAVELQKRIDAAVISPELESKFEAELSKYRTKKIN